MGAGRATLGGGGLIGLIFLVVQLLNNGPGASPQFDFRGQGRPGSDLSAQCKTGEDANQRSECRIVAVINSVQAYWKKKLPNYRPASTVFFEGQVDTACGLANSAVGPFYCPPGEKVYIDLGFYADLRTKFGAKGGPFAEAYVIDRRS